MTLTSLIPFVTRKKVKYSQGVYAGPAADISAPLIMIVDVDDNLRFLFRFYMERNSFRVREVSSAMQVLAYLNHQPDVVLLDYAMPGLGGEKCLPEIRKRVPDTSIIVVSGGIGKKESRSREFCTRHNVFDCFPKPFDQAALVASVRRAVQRKHGYAPAGNS